MSLSRNEIERAKFTFSIYDFEGNERIDATQLGNALRAMGLFPSLRRISNLGGTRTSNEKMLSVEEFLAIYQEAKQDKVEATLDDYMECLSSYDKDQCGKLSVNMLSSLLQGYGEEKLDRDEAEEIIKDCGEPDYNDQVDYKDFLKNLMKGPEIRIPPALLIQQARAELGSDQAAAAEAEGNSTKTLEYESQQGGKRERNMQIKKAENEEANEKAVSGKAGESASANKTDISAPKDGAEGKVISRTRDSVKSNAENEDQQSIASDVSSATGKSGGRKLSRRDSAKPPGANKRATSPDEVSCASDATTPTPGKVTPRKRSSVKSGVEVETNDPNAGVDPNNPVPGRTSSRKSTTERKRDSVKSNPSGGGGRQEDREASPDEGTCASEIHSEGKSIARTRDSQKSDKLDRGVSPGDLSWASECSGGGGGGAGGGGGGNEISKGRNSLKAKDLKDEQGKVSPDMMSCASDATTEDASKSRSSLKSAGGSRSSAKSKKSSDSKNSKKEEEVKAKFQQPLISLKTDGLFGKKKE